MFLIYIYNSIVRNSYFTIFAAGIQKLNIYETILLLISGRTVAIVR